MKREPAGFLSYKRVRSALRPVFCKLVVSFTAVASMAFNPLVDDEIEPPPPPPGSADDPKRSAEEATPTAPEEPYPPRDADPLAPIDSDEKRRVIDYDGHDEPVTAGDVLVWVPRVILSPLYFVSEFVIRRPFYLLGKTAEKHYWPMRLIDFFTFGRERKIGIIPTFLIDFGFRPSVGLYFFWNDFIAHDNDLRLRAATAGVDWLALGLTDRFEVERDHRIGIETTFSQRPDRTFWGFGPESPNDEVRHGEERVEAALVYDAELWRSSSLETRAGVRRVRFDATESAFGDPSVAEALATGRLERLPPGFADGYTAVFQSVAAALDTRRRRHQDPYRKASDWVSPPGTGLRLEVRGEHAASLQRSRDEGARDPRRLSWIRYGARTGVYADLTGDQRVLGLSLSVDFADPLLDRGFVPFTELPSLGGLPPMRGFRFRRLIDRSSVAANLQYRWPIWVFLDGQVDFAVGNVFGEHLDRFDPGLLRATADLGVRTIESRDYTFEVLFGFGSRTFDDGAGVEQFRLVIGSNTTF